MTSSQNWQVFVRFYTKENRVASDSRLSSPFPKPDVIFGQPHSRKLQKFLTLIPENFSKLLLGTCSAYDASTHS